MEPNELNKLRDKCLLFNQYMLDKGGLPNELKTEYIKSNALIQNAYQEGNSYPLMIMSNDIDDQIMRHMPNSMVMEISNLFKEKLNIEINAIDMIRVKRVKKIFEEGKNQ